MKSNQQTVFMACLFVLCMFRAHTNEAFANHLGDKVDEFLYSGMEVLGHNFIQSLS